VTLSQREATTRFPNCRRQFDVNLTAPARTSDFREGSIVNLKKSARGYPLPLVFARYPLGVLEWARAIPIEQLYPVRALHPAAGI
jgi:hypothetical protein